MNKTGALPLQAVYAVSFFYSIFSMTHASFAESISTNLLGTALPYGLHLLVPALMSTALLLLLSSFRAPKKQPSESEPQKTDEKTPTPSFEDSNLLLKNIFLGTLIFVSVNFIGAYGFSAMQWAQYISLGAMALTLMHQAFFAALEQSWKKEKSKEIEELTVCNDPNSPLHPGAWKKNLLENGLQKTIYEKLLFETNLKFLSICLTSSCSFAMFYMMTYSLQGNATLASLSGFALSAAVGCILLGIACNVLSRRVLMLMQYAMNRMDTEKASNIGRQLIHYTDKIDPQIKTSASETAAEGKVNDKGLNLADLTKAMILKAFPTKSGTGLEKENTSGASQQDDPDLQDAVYQMGSILYKTLDAAEQYAKNIDKREKKPLFFDTERERFLASMRRALLILHALDTLSEQDKKLVGTQLEKIAEEKNQNDTKIKKLQRNSTTEAAEAAPSWPSSCRPFEAQMRKAHETLRLHHSLALGSLAKGLDASADSAAAEDEKQDFPWLEEGMQGAVSSGKDRHPSSWVLGLALASMLIGMSSEFSKVWLLVADNTLPDMLFHSQHIWLIIIASYLMVDQVAYMLWMVNVPNPEIAHEHNKASQEADKKKSWPTIMQDHLLSLIESVGSLTMVGLLGGVLYAAGLVGAACQITLLALICGTLFFKKAKGFFEKVAKIDGLKEEMVPNKTDETEKGETKLELSFIEKLKERGNKIKNSTVKGDPVLLNTAWNCIKKVLEFFVLFSISGGGALGLVVALIPAIVNSLRALYTSNTMAKPPETAPDPLVGRAISESQGWLKAAAALIALITTTCLLSNWFEAIGYIKHFANTVSIPLQYQGFFATFWASLGACTFIAVVGGFLFSSLKYAFKEETLATFYRDVFGTINTSGADHAADHAAAHEEGREAEALQVPDPTVAPLDEGELAVKLERVDSSEYAEAGMA